MDMEGRRRSDGANKERKRKTMKEEGRKNASEWAAVLLPAARSSVVVVTVGRKGQGVDRWGPK